jgi:hypothetical protein
MIKVNLINKKRRAYKGRNWTKFISYVLFGILSLYFIGATLYVVISMLTINSKISQIEKESVSVSGSMLQNNDKLSRFVLTKLILTKIEEVNAGRFKYKDYLDKVASYLPSGVVLTSVDFATKGWMVASVNSPNVDSFQDLEKVLSNSKTWKDNNYFSSVYVESVVREKNGSYSTRFQFELKKS